MGVSHGPETAAAHSKRRPNTVQHADISSSSYLYALSSSKAVAKYMGTRNLLPAVKNGRC